MKYFILILLFSASNAYSQIKISDLTRFNIGSDSFAGRKEISKLFSFKGNLIKSETFSSVYKYEFDNTSFNYCDNASYEFLYVDDNLANLNISIRYEYSQIENEAAKYLKSLETLLTDLTEKKYSFEFQPKYSTLINLKRVNSKIDSLNDYYKANTKSVEGIEEKYYGENVYFLKSNIEDARILFFRTSVIKEINQDKSTKAIYFFINIQLTNEKYQEYDGKYSWGTGQY